MRRRAGQQPAPMPRSTSNTRRIALCVRVNGVCYDHTQTHSTRARPHGRRRSEWREATHAGGTRERAKEGRKEGRRPSRSRAAAASAPTAPEGKEEAEGALFFFSASLNLPDDSPSLSRSCRYVSILLKGDLILLLLIITLDIVVVSWNRNWTFNLLDEQ